MPHSHHTADMLKDKLFAILLMYGRDKAGSQKYYYLSVRTDRINDMMKTQRDKGWFEPTEFGRILHSGDGIPDDAVMKMIEAKYGFDHREVVRF